MTERKSINKILKILLSFCMHDDDGVERQFLIFLVVAVAFDLNVERRFCTHDSRSYEFMSQLCCYMLRFFCCRCCFLYVLLNWIWKRLWCDRMTCVEWPINWKRGDYVHRCVCVCTCAYIIFMLMLTLLLPLLLCFTDTASQEEVFDKLLINKRQTI